MLDASDVISEWFGPLMANGAAAPEKVSSWWRKDPKFDQHLRERFGALLALAFEDKLSWPSTQGQFAELLLLDQFARNIYRDQAQMYQGDGRAQALAKTLIDSGSEAELPTVYRIFVRMPLMHSEALSDQDLCLRCFEQLLDGAPEALLEPLRQNLKFSQQHRDIIARFGRFPHRNTILGRETNATEADFLKQPGSSF